MDEFHKQMLDSTIAMYDEQERDPRFKGGDWYHTDLQGLPNFIIRKFVYSPDHINVSLFWPKYLCENERLKGKSLLEIGTGTGVVALSCALYGNPKRVVATDISPFAVENCSRNAEQYGFSKRSNPSFEIRQGSLFEPIGGDEKFDYIFWGFPWNCPDTEIEKVLKERGREFDATPEKITQLMAGLDPGYRFLREFIGEAKKYLTPDGKVILGAGQFSRHDIIEKEALNGGYKVEIPMREKFSVVKSRDWTLECIVYALSPIN